MQAKLIVVVVFASALAATVLVLRQERLQFSHQVAGAHRRIDQTRHELWDQQARIAQLLEAQRLIQAIERAQIQLEPLHPAPGMEHLMPGITTARSSRND